MIDEQRGREGLMRRTGDGLIVFGDRAFWFFGGDWVVRIL